MSGHASGCKLDACRRRRRQAAYHPAGMAAVESCYHVLTDWLCPRGDFCLQGPL